MLLIEITNFPLIPLWLKAYEIDDISINFTVWSWIKENKRNSKSSLTGKNDILEIDPYFFPMAKANGKEYKYPR